MLSEEEYLQIRTNSLPIHHARLAEVYNQEEEHAYRDQLVHLLVGEAGHDVITGPAAIEEGVVANDQFDYPNLTQAALAEASFSTVLQIFARDGQRWTRAEWRPEGVEDDPTIGVHLFQLAYLRYDHHGEESFHLPTSTFGQAHHSDSESRRLRNLLLLLLTMTASPPVENPYDWWLLPRDRGWQLTPLYTQLLSVTGYNFRQEINGYFTYLGVMSRRTVMRERADRAVHLYEEQARSRELILDRLYVQGQLDSSILEYFRVFLNTVTLDRLTLFVPIATIRRYQQELIEYLRGYGVEVPVGFGDQPLPAHLLPIIFQVPPMVDAHGMIVTSAHRM